MEDRIKFQTLHERAGRMNIKMYTMANKFLGFVIDLRIIKPLNPAFYHYFIYSI